MQVTKDIVRDLLPVYLAGEASDDTRAVVEAFLAEDPKLREIVETADRYALPAVEAPANLEKLALERTRQLLGRKNFWLGFALVFSFVPVILKPLWLADVVMLIGLDGWAAFLVTCRKLNPTGLEAPRRWRPRVLWAGTGMLLGLAGGYLIQEQTGWQGAMPYLTVASAVALWIGEKLHQVPTGEEMNRPTTLLGK